MAKAKREINRQQAIRSTQIIVKLGKSHCSPQNLAGPEPARLWPPAPEPGARNATGGDVDLPNDDCTPAGADLGNASSSAPLGEGAAGTR